MYGCYCIAQGLWPPGVVEHHVNVQAEEVVHLPMARLCYVLVDGFHPAHGDLLPAGVFLDGDNDKPSSGLQLDIGNCLRVVSEDVVVHPIALHEMLLC